MSQFDIGDIDPANTSGTELANSLLEPWRDALHSMHKGSSRPSYATAGMCWIDNSSTPWQLKLFDGTQDIVVATYDPSNHHVDTVRADLINESTAGVGVTIDGVLIKDGDVGTSGSRVTKIWASGLDVDGQFVVSDPALAFDTWRTPNANRPTLVEVFTRAETDGAVDGTINMAVDESGGTTADYEDNINLVRNTLPSGTLQIQLATFIIPAGGSYQIVNKNDPTTNNNIREHREFTL